MKAIQEDLPEGTVKKPEKSFGIEMIFRAIGEDAEFDLSEMIMDTKVDSTSKAPKIFMIPGIEGFAKLLRPLAQNLEVHATCLQFDQDAKFTSLQGFAESLVPVSIRVFRISISANWFNRAGYIFVVHFFEITLIKGNTCERILVKTA